jgi:streptogramin lyase
MNADGTGIVTLGTGFSEPIRVAVQADGKILVTDSGNNAIKRMNADGSGIVTLGSGFFWPRGVAVQADGKILVADAGNNAIKRITDDGLSNRVAVSVTVNTITPTFTAVAPICSGASLSALPTTSTNGITGSWSPALDNTTTTTYTFTPTAGQCATTATVTITVDPNTPIFNPFASICSGASLSALPTTSTNGITGTWSPALNNTATTT